MSKKPDGVPYIAYYMSLLCSYCLGPVDSLVNLRVKDKWVFDEDEIVVYTDRADFEVNKTELFGGNLREGGLQGTVEFYPGRGDQIISEALADRQNAGADPAKGPLDMPGYRGVVSLFFRGNDHTGTRGFALATQNPQVPDIGARFRKADNHLENNVAVILTEDEKWYNANPANMIAACLVDADLMGGSLSRLDLVSFNEAASLYNDERFGLTLLWTGDTPIEDFVQTILNHVDTILFYDPFVGKLKLKPLRDDYEVSELEELGPDDCVVTDFRRPMIGENIINEIVLSWTNPETEKVETITYQDQGMIAMAGGEIVSETRDLIGIRERKLGNQVCARELRNAVTPLATCNVEVNRIRAGKRLPGSVFKLTYPLHQIERIVLRVLEVDWGTVDDAKVTLKCVEDVFGMPYAKYTDPQPPIWQPPGKDPETMLENVSYLFRATPFSVISRRRPDAAGELTDDKYPQIAINTYVLPSNDQMDLQTYIPFRPAVDGNGEAIFVGMGERFPQGWNILQEALIEQAVVSQIKLDDTHGPGDWPHEGWLGMFVGADEFSDELFVFKNYQGNGVWNIRRGVLDTVPRKLPWEVGTIVITHSNTYDGYDWSERFAAAAERYKFRIRTSLGLSSLTEEITTTRPDRPYRPYRPANVRLNGQLFGTLNDAQDPNATFFLVWDDLHEPRNWTVSLTWSRRNRFSEDQYFYSWDEADVPPEDGQTTEIAILLPNGQEINRITGLTGTSYELDIIAWTGQFRDVTLRFVSRRNGLESLQGIEMRLLLYWKGYGSDWGRLWGGWPGNGVLTTIEDDDNMVGRLPTVQGLGNVEEEP